jgi:hypothetical protein
MLLGGSLKRGRQVGCTLFGSMSELCIFAAASEECLIFIAMPSLWRIMVGSSSRSWVSGLLSEGLMVWRSSLARPFATGTRPVGLLGVNLYVARTSRSSIFPLANAQSLGGHSAARHPGRPTLCYAWGRRHSDSCPKPIRAGASRHICPIDIAHSSVSVTCSRSKNGALPLGGCSGIVSWR